MSLRILDALNTFHPMHGESWCGWPDGAAPVEHDAHSGAMPTPRAALESLRDALHRERDKILATLGTVERTLAWMDRNTEDK